MSSIVFGSYTVVDDSPLEILEPIVSSSSIITISPACEIGVNSGTSSVIQINSGVSFVVQSSLGDRSEYNYIIWNPSPNTSLNVGYATLASGTITINNKPKMVWLFSIGSAFCFIYNKIPVIPITKKINRIIRLTMCFFMLKILIF